MLSTLANFLNGYFGNNNTLQMVSACGLHLISKLRRDAALYLPPTAPYQGRGRPPIYGERLNPKDIDSKYRVATHTSKHHHGSLSNAVSA
ncbi:MAG: transposase [Candidatus Poribacteria bacterium]|nr:transposase [Candidatus Poribacteria bacterium]MDE0467524.1 transposase [Candidatus Poribacteria bacterium]